MTVCVCVKNPVTPRLGTDESLLFCKDCCVNLCVRVRALPGIAGESAADDPGENARLVFLVCAYLWKVGRLHAKSRARRANASVRGPGSPSEGRLLWVGCAYALVRGGRVDVWMRVSQEPRTRAGSCLV